MEGASREWQSVTGCCCRQGLVGCQEDADLDPSVLEATGGP